jgi:hypothetical protein
MKFDKIISIIIVLVFAVLLLAAINYFLTQQNIKAQFITKDKNISNSAQKINNQNISNTNMLGTNLNVCEGCHLSGKSSIPQALTVKPHIEGGKYCLECHNFSHSMHPINNNVTCGKCHGDIKNNIIIPRFINGNIVCNNCHDYPDALKPSLGNLITIHRLRNVSCITCHAVRCINCHKEIGSSERWNNRFNHFNTILGTLPGNVSAS